MDGTPTELETSVVCTWLMHGDTGKTVAAAATAAARLEARNCSSEYLQKGSFSFYIINFHL